MLDLPNLSNFLSQDWEEKPNTNEIISCVVMPLFEDPVHGQGIILTQRALHLKSHPGQISFPGGVHEESDPNLLECALREWEEEMGVSKNSLTTLGRHTGLSTRTGFHITPFVCLYSGDFQFSLNKDEVEKTILLPLSQLQSSPFYAMSVPKRIPLDYISYFDLEEGLLWGATCEMILRFLKEFGNFDRKPKFVEPNLPHPPFLNPRLL
ncbi:coenzyme A pyrophosphatase [Leptospira kobayashii]|uniref:Coenzyme A pyrophosphatase n=1 Tax=Leptospira kobayashii TaxID=1917830 RepID=A0ABM7UFN3_9LEPT|nr:CoA pyrophosphatase [Leptospira kobayashii]BDA77207.1 coenzyme A pyrophosphatase [Leptospira kobayashii]